MVNDLQCYVNRAGVITNEDSLMCIILYNAHWRNKALHTMLQILFHSSAVENYFTKLFRLISLVLCPSAGETTIKIIVRYSHKAMGNKNIATEKQSKTKCFIWKQNVSYIS